MTFRTIVLDKQGVALKLVMAGRAFLFRIRVANLAVALHRPGRDLMLAFPLGRMGHRRHVTFRTKILVVAYLTAAGVTIGTMALQPFCFVKVVLRFNGSGGVADGAHVADVTCQARKSIQLGAVLMGARFEFDRMILRRAAVSVRVAVNASARSDRAFIAVAQVVTVITDRHAGLDGSARFMRESSMASAAADTPRQMRVVFEIQNRVYKIIQVAAVTKSALAGTNKR